jgi:hypothetical protein
MSFQIIGGASQRFYHTIPSDLDLITTTPSREAIFKYLSQIGYDKFPEFMLDILIKVEGHKPGDVTDGVGDEKQDIITINPSGQRCLTQCKHTINYTDHYSGDELDRMVSAMLRKNCTQAIFVTNSDLTPQGKKYITDDEYNRGVTNPADHRSIDYWNGFKIWERVKNNSDIINKWFSGLGQVHGLRSFKFDLTIQIMPFEQDALFASNTFDKLLELLGNHGWMQTANAEEYTTSLSTHYDVKVSRWFQFSGALDINFVLPEQKPSFVNKPMYALTVEVLLKSNDKYIPSKIRDEIVCELGDDLLDQLQDGQWWHLTSSPIRSFIYLHDVAEPREIKLASAMTFVKTGGVTIREFSYCNIVSDQFEFDGESIWLHTGTGVQVIQSFDQQLNPVEVYDHQIAQYNQLKRMESFNFFAVKPIASPLIMRVRRLLKKDWVALQHNDDALLWGIDPEEDTDEIAHYHQKIKNLQLEIKEVAPEDVGSILSLVQKDLPPPMSVYIAELSEISFPVKLDKRMFWLSKDLPLTRPIELPKAAELVSFKYGFENQFGYDHMNGRRTEQANSSEIPDMLFDFFTLRGKRMLDIGAIRQNPISINIRYCENRLERSEQLAEEYIKEFLATYEEINELLNGER